jgi:hypothetical protein
MAKSPKVDQSDELAEAKRIMERLVKTPHKLHKDEPSRKRAAEERRTPKRKAKP